MIIPASPIPPLMRACGTALSMAARSWTFAPEEREPRVLGNKAICTDLEEVRIVFDMQTRAAVVWRRAGHEIVCADPRVAAFSKEIATVGSSEASNEVIAERLLDDLVAQASVSDDRFGALMLRPTDDTDVCESCDEMATELRLAANVVEALTRRPVHRTGGGGYLTSDPMILNWRVVAAGVKRSMDASAATVFETELQNVIGYQMLVRVNSERSNATRRGKQRKSSAERTEDSAIGLAVYITELLDSDATASHYPEGLIELDWSSFRS